MKRDMKRLVVRIEDDTCTALETKTMEQGVTLTAFVVAMAEAAASGELDPDLVRRARVIDVERRRRSPIQEP